jgi:hypothetical protein
MPGRCGCELAHVPEAVTPQLTVNVIEELAGKLGKIIPLGDCKIAIVAPPGLGQDAPPVVALHVTAVQANPAATGSLSDAPSEGPGPLLVATMV